MPRTTIVEISSLEQAQMLAALRRLNKVTPINTAALRRKIADETVERGSYPFA